MSKENNKLLLLVENFNTLFEKSENTILKTGSEEPFYQAAQNDQPATIYSRENYLSSALHEIAHWCLAGIERRKQDDFGYWYKPEGRSIKEQIEFEQVEIKPQAIEWALSLCCDHQFVYSADNLAQNIQASDQFKQSVHEQLINYLKHDSLPSRAQLLFKHLNHIFRNDQPVELPSV